MKLSALILLVLCASMALCQTVVRAELYRDNGSGKPGNVVKSFTPKDNPIHCVITLKPLTSGATFTGTLIAVNAGGVQNYRVASTDLATIAGMDRVDFKFSLPNPWPVGTYRVEVKVNGKSLRTVAFEIK